jgi:hypothetical protein
MSDGQGKCEATKGSEAVFRVAPEAPNNKLGASAPKAARSKK